MSEPTSTASQDSATAWVDGNALDQDILVDTSSLMKLLPLAAIGSALAFVNEFLTRR